MYIANKQIIKLNTGKHSNNPKEGREEGGEKQRT